MTQKNYRSNWREMSSSDLKLELDMYRRWINKVGGTDKQMYRLKVMEEIYAQKLNTELSLFNLVVPPVENNKYLHNTKKGV